jgi:hypothetical protein
MTKHVTRLLLILVLLLMSAPITSAGPVTQSQPPAEEGARPVTDGTLLEQAARPRQHRSDRIRFGKVAPDRIPSRPENGSLILRPPFWISNRLISF